MPPRQEKVEKASPDKAADMILQYLRKQNRPYSATDISTNLHNKVTKAAAAKTLKELHERGELMGRTSGKQAVYHVPQNPSEVATPEELSAMDDEMTSLKESITQLKAEYKTLATNLNNLQSTVTTNDLREAVQELEDTRTELLERLTPLREGNVSPIPMAEREKVEKEYVKARRDAVVRKRIFEEFWGLVRDGLPDGVLAGDVWVSIFFSRLG
ncbi:MAG: regulatory particle non-ATPase [Watsoniomyces obsoletus]|nr:MAG: regulatory particle non-ATPase [Watsoniomyces obsoletus]